MTLCACLGPIKGEPHCPCTMVQMGLKKNEDYKMPEEEVEKLRAVMKTILTRNEDERTTGQN